MAFGGDVQVHPGAEKASADELMREIGHGFYVMGGSVQASPGLTGGFLQPALIVEVQRGKPLRRLRSLWLGFTTKGVANKALVALGDTRTLRTTTASAQKGMPWQRLEYPVTAPAALCKDIDVVRTNISA